MTGSDRMSMPHAPIERWIPAASHSKIRMKKGSRIFIPGPARTTAGADHPFQRVTGGQKASEGAAGIRCGEAPFGGQGHHLPFAGGELGEAGGGAS